MKIENTTFDQLNACFSVLMQIIEHLPGYGDGGVDEMIDEVKREMKNEDVH